MVRGALCRAYGERARTLLEGAGPVRPAQPGARAAAPGLYAMPTGSGLLPVGVGARRGDCVPSAWDVVARHLRPMRRRPSMGPTGGRNLQMPWSTRVSRRICAGGCHSAVTDPSRPAVRQDVQGLDLRVATLHRFTDAWRGDGHRPGLRRPSDGLVARKIPGDYRLRRERLLACSGRTCWGEIACVGQQRRCL